MVGVEREIPPRLLVPMCPRCGDTRLNTDGGTSPIRCRRCGHDLYTERPRSYAEMEGLIALGEASEGPEPPRRRLLGFARDRIRLLGVKLGIR